MNIKLLYLIPLFFISTVFADNPTVLEQNPMVARLDFVEANINQIQANERTLFAQNQNLANQLNVIASANNQISPVQSNNDVTVLVLLSVLMMFLILMGCVERQTPTKKIAKVTKQPKAQPQPMPELKREAQDEEYDFMGSQEAVPARFNLAEAYMQMREFQQAKRVLEGILDQGDSDQRQKASALLSQLPSL